MLSSGQQHRLRVQPQSSEIRDWIQKQCKWQRVSGKTEPVAEMLYNAACVDGSKMNTFFPLYQVNICSDAPECGAGNAGCELENGRAVNPVGVEKTLEYSTDGLIKLTYRGPLNTPTGAVEAQKPQSGFKSTQRLIDSLIRQCLLFFPLQEPGTPSPLISCAIKTPSPAR